MATKDVLRYFGYQQITGMTTPTALTVPTKATDGNSNVPTATIALLQAEGAAIRWRDDGTAPTASIGMILQLGADPYPYDGPLSAIRFIETATGAKLNVSYYA